MHDYPYLETKSVWGHEVKTLVHDERSRTWYGLTDIQTRDWWQRWNPNLMHLARQGDRVLDVGANEGFVACVLAKYTGGPVVAVEPVGENCRWMAVQLALNGISDQVAVHNTIAGAAPGRGRVQHERTVDAKEGEEREVVTLDRYQGFEPTLVKIDVEGAEADVIRGSEDILSRVRPRLEIELHLSPPPGIDMRTYGKDPEEIFRILARYDYAVFRESRYEAPHFVNQIHSAAGIVYGGLYCIPKEQLPV